MSSKNPRPESIDAEKIRAIQQWCAQHRAVVAAYLFGSAAMGTMKPASDIDIALLVESGQEDSFPLLSVIAELDGLCGGNADVVLLNRAGELLKFEVRKTGRLIFERDSTMRKHFEIMGRKRYEDFLYLHRKYTLKNLYGKHHGQHRSG